MCAPINVIFCCPIKICIFLNTEPKYRHDRPANELNQKLCLVFKVLDSETVAFTCHLASVHFHSVSLHRRLILATLDHHVSNGFSFFWYDLSVWRIFFFNIHIRMGRSHRYRTVRWRTVSFESIPLGNNIVSVLADTCVTRWFDFYLNGKIYKFYGKKNNKNGWKKNRKKLK